MITINGVRKEAEGMSLLEYLALENYNPARVAVEKNGDIVPKVQYAETIICDGDSIEVVSFVGGG